MGTPIQTVLIYGYGVMGRGVARTFADAGFATFVKSSRAGKLEGLPAKTSVVERLPNEAPDLVIEFVPEDVRQAGGLRRSRGGLSGRSAADRDGDLGTRSGRARAQDEAPRALSRHS